MSYGVSWCQYDERSYRQGRKTLCSVLPQNLEGVYTSAYPDSMKKMQKLFVYYWYTCRQLFRTCGSKYALWTPSNDCRPDEKEVSACSPTAKHVPWDKWRRYRVRADMLCRSGFATAECLGQRWPLLWTQLFDVEHICSSPSSPLRHWNHHAFNRWSRDAHTLLGVALCMYSAIYNISWHRRIPCHSFFRSPAQTPVFKPKQVSNVKQAIE